VGLAVGLSFAQEDDESRFPPITPENRSQTEMIQMLSQGGVHQLTWSPNGKQLAVTAEGGTWIYDVTQPDMPARHLNENSLRSYVAYAPHDDIYISYTPQDFCPMGICESGQQLLVRDVNTHEVLHEIYMSGIEAQFIRDGEYLVISSYSHGIVIWRTDSFRKNIGKHPSEFMQCQIRTQAPVSYVRFSDDERFVTYEGWRVQMMSPGDGSVWFWDTETCEVHLEVKQLEDDGASPEYAHIYGYSRDGEYAIIPYYVETEEGRSGNWGLWDVIAAQLVTNLPKTLDLNALWGFTPDNQHLLFYDADTSLAQIWHIESQMATRSFYADKFYSFDDTHLLMLRAGDLYRINITDEILLRDDELDIIGIHLSDDKQWLFLTYADGHMILWDWTTDTLIETWENAIDTNLSLDKSKIVTSAVNGIFVWDIAKREYTRLDYWVHTGNRVIWSDTDNTMVTYGQDERYPVITDYGHHAMGFFVWALTKSGFEIRWGYPSETILLDVADDFIMMMNDDMIEFLDTTTGELVTSFAPNDCLIGDQSTPFCARWDALRASRYVPTQVTPYVVRDGTLLIVTHPDYPNQPMTYIIPDHIASQLDTFTNPEPDDADEEVEWVITTDGDLLVRFGYTVYNVTQDTAMRMGYVSAPDDFCGDECYPFPFSWIWFSQDGARLFASGWAENDHFPGFNDIISAWDIQTGRHLYDIRGDVDRYSYLSSDEQYVFLIGSDAYVGGGKTLYNRRASVFDAFTGELVISVETFDEGADKITVSPKRRFVVVYSDAPRLWAVVEDEGVQP